jgi:RNA polymerase sigma-70 factor, ECF subfamily
MDADDVSRLYDAHARGVAGFFVRRTGDPHAALDLLGETFLVAFERRESCQARSERERAAWLYRIAANKLMDHYRRGARDRRLADRVIGALREPTADELAVLERLEGPSDQEQVVREAFAALDGDQREAVRLRILEERPYSALSRELGVSEPTARARVSRGLRVMRRVVAGEPEVDS